MSSENPPGGGGSGSRVRAMISNITHKGGDDVPISSPTLISETKGVISNDRPKAVTSNSGGNDGNVPFTFPQVYRPNPNRQSTIQPSQKSNAENRISMLAHKPNPVNDADIEKTREADGMITNPVSEAVERPTSPSSSSSSGGFFSTLRSPRKRREKGNKVTSPVTSPRRTRGKDSSTLRVSSPKPQQAEEREYRTKSPPIKKSVLEEREYRTKSPARAKSPRANVSPSLDPQSRPTRPVPISSPSPCKVLNERICSLCQSNLRKESLRHQVATSPTGGVPPSRRSALRSPRGERSNPTCCSPPPRAERIGMNLREESDSHVITPGQASKAIQVIRSSPAHQLSDIRLLVQRCEVCMHSMEGANEAEARLLGVVADAMNRVSLSLESHEKRDNRMSMQGSSSSLDDEDDDFESYGTMRSRAQFICHSAERDDRSSPTQSRKEALLKNDGEGGAERSAGRGRGEGRGRGRGRGGIQRQTRRERSLSTGSQMALVMAEIESTEFAYVNYLDGAITYFMNPMLESIGRNGLTEPLVRQLFSNTTVMLEFNRSLLEKFTAGGQINAKNIGTAFGEMAPFLKVYIQYVSEYEDVMKALAQLSMQRSTRRFVEKCARMFQRNKESTVGLADLLIMPIQRVPRYVLLLKELLKHMDANDPHRPLIEKAQCDVSAIATHINETKRRRDMMMKVMEIQNKLEFDYKNLVEPHRLVVREGKLIRTWSAETTDQTCHAIMFNDALLWCRYKSESKLLDGGLLLKGYLPLDEIVCSLEQPHPDDDVIFDITIPRFGKSQLSVMTVRATSKEDKDGWISALREWSDKARSEAASHPDLERTFGLRHMVGFLYKKSDNFHNWRLRFFRHVGNTLEYYMEQPTILGTPRGMFNLKQFELHLAVEKTKLIFELRPTDSSADVLKEEEQNRSYFFMVKEEHTFVMFRVWLTALAKSVAKVADNVFKTYPPLQPADALEEGLIPPEVICNLI